MERLWSVLSNSANYIGSPILNSSSNSNLSKRFYHNCPENNIMSGVLNNVNVSSENNASGMGVGATVASTLNSTSLPSANDASSHLGMANSASRPASSTGIRLGLTTSSSRSSVVGNNSGLVIGGSIGSSNHSSSSLTGTGLNPGSSFGIGDRSSSRNAIDSSGNEITTEKAIKKIFHHDSYTVLIEQNIKLSTKILEDEYGLLKRSTLGKNTRELRSINQSLRDPLISVFGELGISLHKYIRSLVACLLYGNVRGFFLPLVWTSSEAEGPIPLDYPSLSDCTNEHYAMITMNDIVNTLIPDKEVPYGNVKLDKNPFVIFSGVPKKEATIALKAFLGFRKIDVPDSKRKRDHTPKLVGLNDGTVSLTSANFNVKEVHFQYMKQYLNVKQLKSKNLALWNTLESNNQRFRSSINHFLRKNFYYIGQHLQRSQGTGYVIGLFGIQDYDRVQMKKGPNTLGYKGSTKVEDQDNLTILPSYNMQYVTHQIGGKITSAQSLLDTTIETEFLDKEFSKVIYEVGQIVPPVHSEGITTP